MLPIQRFAQHLRREARVKMFGKRPFASKAILVGLLSLVGLTGCTTFTNMHKALVNSTHWNETVLIMRNRSFSAKAWHCRKHHFCDRKYIKDFCAGFRTGYEDVANGADGCTPAFPPKEYWSWEFQSAEGAQRTSAWYAGYPHGVRAAEEDGVANWTQLPMSVEMQSQYQQTGMFTHEGTLYPIPTGQETVEGAYPTPIPMESGVAPPQGNLEEIVPDAPSELGIGSGTRIPLGPGQ